MSDAGRPAAVSSYVLRPLWWLPAAVAAGTLMFVAGSTAARAEDESFDNGYRLEAVVDDDYGGGDEVPLTYDNPLTGETRASAYRWGGGPAPEPGDRVAIEVDRADPRDVALAGQRYPGDPLGYVSIPAVVVLVVFAGRLGGAWRTERLISGPGPSFAMLGTVGAPRFGSRRLRLHLYPLDAKPGSPPLCSVALMSSAGLPVGGPAFVVEAKGRPRPFGRIVARAGDAVLWPRGRSLSASSKVRLPAERIDPAAPTELAMSAGVVRTDSVRRSLVPLAVLGVAACGSVGVTALTLDGARDARQLDRVGVEVVATVTRSRPDDLSVTATFRLPGRDERLSARVPVDYPEDWDVGDRLLAIVDPDDPDRIRFVDEPYDALEPLLWGWTPAFLATWWACSSLRWRRLERRATGGPWSELDTWVTGRRFDWTLTADVLEVAVARPGAPVASCVLRLPTTLDWWSRSAGVGPTGAVQRMAAGGTAAPGEAVALRRENVIVPAWGPARAPRGDGMGFLPSMTAGDWRAAQGWSPASGMIPLGSSFLVLRKPRIEVRPGFLHLYLPPYFNRRTWRIPADQVIAADLTGGPSDVELTIEAAEAGLRLVYLPTTNALTALAPTLGLFFDVPQTPPPLRTLLALGSYDNLGFWETRSGKARVDGVLLRAVNPSAALATLSTIGIEPVDPRAWIHRRSADQNRC